MQTEGVTLTTAALLLLLLLLHLLLLLLLLHLLLLTLLLLHLLGLFVSWGQLFSTLFVRFFVEPSWASTSYFIDLLVSSAFAASASGLGWSGRLFLLLLGL